MHIAELTFVELYEDQALGAVSALNEFRNDARVRNDISPADELTSLPGGQRRLRFAEPPGWWNRVEVFENENTGALEFQNLTQRRARAEAFLVPTQRQLIDGFVQDVISSPNPDQTTAHTLFELLVPNTLKDYAPDQNHLMLLVDEASARYPWELMTRPQQRQRRADCRAGGPGAQPESRSFPRASTGRDGQVCAGCGRSAQ